MAGTDEGTGVLVSETYLQTLDSYNQTQIKILERLEDSRKDQGDILKRLDKQIQQNTKIIQQHDIRLVKLESLTTSIKATLDGIQEEQKEFRNYVNDRFDGFQNYVDTRFDGIQNYVDTRFDGIQEEQKEFRNYVDTRFDGIQEEQKEFRNYVDTRFDKVDQRIFWTMTGGVAFLTLVMSFMTIILKFA